MQRPLTIPRHTYQVLTKGPRRLARLATELPWPSNVSMGVSVENTDTLWRVDQLRQVPAAVRFLSAEPLLGPLVGLSLQELNLVVAGGESGPGTRALNLDWPRSLRDHCHAADVAFFFKQVGGRTPKAGGRRLEWPHLGPDALHGSTPLRTPLPAARAVDP